MVNVDIRTNFVANEHNTKDVVAIGSLNEAIVSWCKYANLQERKHAVAALTMIYDIRLAGVMQEWITESFVLFTKTKCFSSNFEKVPTHGTM